MLYWSLTNQNLTVMKSLRILHWLILTLMDVNCVSNSPQAPTNNSNVEAGFSPLACSTFLSEGSSFQASSSGYSTASSSFSGWQSTGGRSGYDSSSSSSGAPLRGGSSGYYAWSSSSSEWLSPGRSSGSTVIQSGLPTSPAGNCFRFCSYGCRSILYLCF